MKSVLFLIFSLASIIKAIDEECAKEQCQVYYDRCMQEVFGCAAAYQRCKGQCGETEPCFQQCASTNQKLYSLYQCWQLYCQDQTQKQLNCKIEKCKNLFETECLSTKNNELECFLRFRNSHPECVKF